MYYVHHNISGICTMIYDMTINVLFCFNLIGWCWRRLFFSSFSYTQRRLSAVSVVYITLYIYDVQRVLCCMIVHIFTKWVILCRDIPRTVICILCHTVQYMYLEYYCLYTVLYHPALSAVEGF